jgi:hypothetical protein
MSISHTSDIAVDTNVHSTLWTCTGCQNFTNMAHGKKTSFCYFLYVGLQCNKFNLFSYLFDYFNSEIHLNH